MLKRWVYICFLIKVYYSGTDSYKDQKVSSHKLLHRKVKVIEKRWWNLWTSIVERGDLNLMERN